MEPEIFVRVAAYRDPECEWTIRDAFEKATYPERLRFGVCWQYIPDEDPPTVRLHGWQDQVRMIRVLATRARGVCWARHQTEQLWRGEPYTLQIDSHMRFIEGWDEAFLEQLRLCDSERAVLSSSPARYTPPDDLQLDSRPTIRCATPFRKGGNLRFQGVMLDRAPERPLRGPFLAAGVLFSSSRVLEEVPYDPNLYFDQEEAGYAVRLYTHGWDVFSPSRVLLYHYYNVDRSNGTRRPLHWVDNLDWGRLQEVGQTRFQALTHGPQARAGIDLGRYGLGTARTLAQFEAFSGVDFERRRVSNRALEGLFVDDLRRYRAARPKPERGGPSGGPTDVPGSASPGGETTVLRLQAGDFAPFFRLESAVGRERQIQSLGGEWTILLCVRSAGELGRWFPSLPQIPQPVKAIIVVGDGAGEVDARCLADAEGWQIWFDGGGRVIELFLGAESEGVSTALLGPNLRVQQLFSGGDPVSQIHSAVRSLPTTNRAARVRCVDRHAPVLIVPQAIRPEECGRLIGYFQGHPQFQGRVGPGAGQVSLSNKVRTDCIVRGAALELVDELLARRVFPEIEKVFGLEVSHREEYKLGCYSAGGAPEKRSGRETPKDGFFSRHRDNLTPALNYRRYAISINLNENFEGGELVFPEYGEGGYKLGAGDGLVFPCSLTHEVKPMRRGQRYMLIGFLFSEQDVVRIPDDRRKEVYRISAPRISHGIADVVGNRQRSA